MFKKLISFILVLALAMSCAAFATEIDARSATIKVTVNKYEIEESVLRTTGTTGGGEWLANFKIENISEQVTTPISWKITANGKDATYSATDSKGSYVGIYSSDLKGVVDNSKLTTTITVVATATITTPGGDKIVESEEVTFTIINTNGNDPISEDEKKKYDPDDDGDEGVDDGTKGLVLQLNISAPSEVFDGDSIPVTATPVMTEEAMKLYKSITITNAKVVTEYWVSVNGGTGTLYTTREGFNTKGITINYDYVDAKIGTTYYFWAIIKATGTIAPIPQGE